MARTGMANPISRLRNLAQVGASDFTLGTVTYWSDDQLQTILDGYRADVYREPVSSIATYDNGGTAHYYDYYTNPGDDGAAYEEGTAQFRVATSVGSAVAPSTITYQAGHISFGTVDQGGTAYYLTARRFDLNAAASDIWRTKAANVSTYYDFSVDGQSMSRSQMHKHYIEMSKQFAGFAQPISVRMVRSDF